MIVKISGEGSSSPFRARIFPGMLKMRDQFFLLGLQGSEFDNRRKLFDQKFAPLAEAAEATRDAAFEIVTLTSHNRDLLEGGQGFRVQDDHLHIDETIDKALRQGVSKLMTQSIVATKSGLQRILKSPLGLNIGFVFDNEKEFDKGIKKIRAQGNDELANYLTDVYSHWLGPLTLTRNKWEHEGRTLPDISYQLQGPASVRVILPDVDRVPIDIFAKLTANRVLLFVENMMVYTLSTNFEVKQIYVIEIPAEQRNPDDPVRFEYGGVGLSTAPRWRLQYQDTQDFV